MSLSRRIFLKSAGVFGFSTIVIGATKGVAFGQQTAGSLPIIKFSNKDQLAKITREMFSENLNSVFRFGKVDLSLIRVIDSKESSIVDSKGKSGECFSLVFQGPHERALEQNTYTVKHDRLGKFNIFIVPADAENKAGLNYEAVFNKIPQ
jgi:hypothetical protein